MTCKTRSRDARSSQKWVNRFKKKSIFLKKKEEEKIEFLRVRNDTAADRDRSPIRRLRFPPFGRNIPRILLTLDFFGSLCLSLKDHISTFQSTKFHSFHSTDRHWSRGHHVTTSCALLADGMSRDWKKNHWKWHFRVNRDRYITSPTGGTWAGSPPGGTWHWKFSRIKSMTKWRK